MTAKEYLSQAYRLDNLINNNVRELERLRDLATRVASPSYEEHYSAPRSQEPPFVKYTNRYIDLDRTINADIDRYVALKTEIRQTIAKLKNADEQLVLRLKYLDHLTWPQVAHELKVDKSTVRRWHDAALEHLELIMASSKGDWSI